MTTAWSTQELDIVETLTRRVRLMSLAQIASLWWPDLASHGTVRQKLQWLHEGKLLQRAVINAHPLLTPDVPLAAWEPGAVQPDPHEAVRRIRGRWTSETEPTEVYWASPRAANLFGSTARQLPSLFHRDHDLLLSDVYILYRHRRPDCAQRWVGEHVFAKAGFRIKDPDAFLFDDAGLPICVIESAGHYDVRQIESFHEYCVERDLPYELW